MNMTQQYYGNNLAGSPYHQQDYSGFFSSQRGMNQYSNGNQTSINTNLIWVQGIEGAKAFMLASGDKVILLDSEIENRAYIKIADELGATKLRRFDLTEIFDQDCPNQLNEYVRKDELQSLIMSMLPQVQNQESEVIQNESAISANKQPVVKRTAT